MRINEAESRLIFVFQQVLLNLRVVVVVVSYLGITACSSDVMELDSSREYVDYQYVGIPSSPPPGVVRHCWEEPIVDYESQTPGVKGDGKWYYPSAVVVRQLRAGRWRPCEQGSAHLGGTQR